MDPSMSAKSTHQLRPRIYSKEEWNAQKINFTKLYRSNTLKNTMEIMERDHGFFATERQYKRKISKWGLEKNVKGAEMLLIIRKKVERKIASDKDSSFSVRNRKVSCDKISRYERRKNFLALEPLRLTEGVVSSTPMGITCHTPPPRKISISHSPSLLPQQISNECGIADGLISMDIDHEPGIRQSAILFQCQQSQVASAPLLGALQDKLPTVVAPIPSRSIIQSDTVALALHDINASVPASQIWQNFWEDSPSNLDVTSSANSLDSSVEELLSGGSGRASFSPIPEDDTADLGISECLSHREKKCVQQLTALRDELGYAYPKVLSFTLQLSSLLMIQRRFKYVSNALWQLAEARRSIVQSIDETTTGAVKILMPMFYSETCQSKSDQFLNLLSDCVTRVSQSVNSAIYGRLQYLRAEIAEIDQVRKVALVHKNFLQVERIGIAWRCDIRLLNSICLAIDDLISSAIVAALTTRGFRLEVREIQDRLTLKDQRDLKMPKKLTGRFSFIKMSDIEFSNCVWILKSCF